ncbi:putative enhancer of polycomb-like protein 1 [Diplocarpon rosae]|nr:putative enhancer of polycomb-like protein 1 [Diplocarpon rosae]
MVPPPRTVRTRKLAKSFWQLVLREDELDSEEYHALQHQNNVATSTGVEAGEEKEYHLQAALKSATNSNAKQAEEIPAPPTAEGADIDYDSLYALVYEKPATYIRFSETVEDTTGCQYNMTTEDDVFLKAYNANKIPAQKCSEDDFEKLMDLYEKQGSAQTPFASVDGTVLPYEKMRAVIDQHFSGRNVGYKEDVYEHWKRCRQASGNHPLQPRVKEEEDPNKDESDPYVCFRRRDMNVRRKTRARDTQSQEKIKRLRKELEEGKQLVDLAFDREKIKKETIQNERALFEQRAKVKEHKIRLGIKADDLEDLVNQKPQKRKVQDYNQMQRPPGQQHRLPARPESRPLEVDLIQLSDLMAQKENVLQMEIEEKTQQHRKWNQGHVDLTREPLSPVEGHGPEAGFRPATAQYQYLMTPPSSVTSESFDHPSPVQEHPEPQAFRFTYPPGDDEYQRQPAYRRRIGRSGRLWIDRRGMSFPAREMDHALSDRWKYDDKDDDEQPVYDVDPYDTKALRFRASIPYPAHISTQRSRQEDRAMPQARASGSNIANRPAQPGAQSQPQPEAPT